MGTAARHLRRGKEAIVDELLVMQGISKNFGPVQALQDVQLTLRRGEVLALMGENGAGKSTLMNILSGGLMHFKGDVFLGGKKVSIGSPLAARALGIAKIHQELQLVREMSVAENIFMGREMAGKAGFVNKKDQEKEAQRYLDMLEVDIKPNRLVKSLRVGEQQMVEIAKAISLNTQILIMDEPTSALSKAETEKLFTVIRSLTAHDVSIIYITHRMEEVFEISDRITVLRDGLYIDTVNTKETSHEALISMMVGREVNDVYPKEHTMAGQEVLRVEDVSLTFPPGSFKRSIRGISFHLFRGEVLGFSGLLGSGRTELMEALFGVYPNLVKGKLFVEGKQVHLRSPQDAIDAGISFATEDRKGRGLVLLRTIGENMSLPLLRRFSPRFFMRGKEEGKEWDKQMTSLRIKAPSARTLSSSLSGGNQQKVILGRWLMTRPKVLLLDEPTRGIDVGAKAEIYSLIGDLAKQGIGIIVVSSDLPEIIGICDRIITLCEGQMTGEFTQAEATQEKLLYAATFKNPAEAV